jgi:hypothetical protein
VDSSCNERSISPLARASSACSTAGFECTVILASIARWMKRSSTRQWETAAATASPNAKPQTWAQCATPPPPVSGAATSQDWANTSSRPNHSGSITHAGAEKVPGRNGKKK